MLRLRNFAKDGRGGVFGAPFLLSVAFGVFSALSRSSLLVSDSDASSGTRRRSDELLEWPKDFCSRKATSFAGETRLLGTASSSMVFPREREDGGAFSVRLRKDIEVKLRSRRFYCEVQRGHYAREHGRWMCYMLEQPWPIAATGQAVGSLHGLGGGLGGHSSLQLGVLVGIQEEGVR